MTDTQQHAAAEVWKLHIWQKFRESNVFTKEIARVNLTKYFLVRLNLSFFHTVYCEIIIVSFFHTVHTRLATVFDI